MWFTEGCVSREDDVEFVRDIRRASAGLRSGPSKRSPRAMLREFVLDLSFWESEQGFHNEPPQRDARGKAPQAASKVRDCDHASSERNRKSKRKTRMTNDPSNAQIKSSNSNRNSNNNADSKPVWKTATDPTTGRTYYYDAVSRKTQWNKPPEIKAMEKQKKLEKKKKDLEFFKDMERNLCASLKRGELIPGVPAVDTRKEGQPAEKVRSARVRTISGMDEVLLAELRDDRNIVRHEIQQRQKPTRPPASSSRVNSTTGDKMGRPPLPDASYAPKRSFHTPTESTTNPYQIDENKVHHNTPLHENASNLLGESLIKESNINVAAKKGSGTKEVGGKPAPPPLGHTRRNTGGTIYLQNTMTNPDIKATIKCVCGVFRAHIVQTAERHAARSPTSVATNSVDADIFADNYDSGGSRNSEVPSLDEVLAFYEEFYRRSRMEHDTIIMSLIYMERLVKATSGVVAPTPNNWRSSLFACMVLASKVWDDLSMWNIDFSNVSAHTAGLSSFTLQRINQLELALLKSLNFDVKVPASEYAKYYFLIRSMLVRSGLVKEGEKPLSKHEAFDKLETKTSNYQRTKIARPAHARRVKSMDDKFSQLLSNEQTKLGPVLRDTVCLEQLILG